MKHIQFQIVLLKTDFNCWKDNNNKEQLMNRKQQQANPNTPPPPKKKLAHHTPDSANYKDEFGHGGVGEDGSADYPPQFVRADQTLPGDVGGWEF